MGSRAAKARQAPHGFRSFDEILNLVVDRTTTSESDFAATRFSTGVRALDDKIKGLKPSDLIVLAGRPGSGKTSLAARIAYNIASRPKAVSAENKGRLTEGGVVGFYSLGAPSEQLATRIISDQTQISLSKIRTGDLTETEFERIVVCSQNLQNVPIYIDETGNLTISQIAARARRIKRQPGLNVLFVDHLHLLLPQQVRDSDDLAVELSRILRDLKSLAAELDIGIFVIFETHDPGTIAYERDSRFILSELDHGTVDFAASLARENYSSDAEIYFWDGEVGRASGAEDDVGEDLAPAIITFDFHDHLSRKLHDWDQALRRIDQNLDGFRSAGKE